MDKLSLLGIVLGASGILVGQMLEGDISPCCFRDGLYDCVRRHARCGDGANSGACVFHALGWEMGAVPAKFIEACPDRPDRRVVCGGTQGRLLSLEARIDTVSDPYLQKGLQLLVDGNSEKRSAS